MSLATPIPPVNPVQASAVAPDALARLLAGGVVDGRVLTANLQAGLLRLMLGSGPVDLKAAGVTLPPGTRVALQQTGTDAQGRVIQIVPLASAATADAAAFSPRLQPFLAHFLPATRPALLAQGAAAAVQDSATREQAVTAGRQGEAALADQPVARPPQSPVIAAREMLMPLIRTALARQGGFAPLYANMQAALAAPVEAVPVPVRTAIANLLDHPFDPAADDPAAQLHRAVAQSGLFQEAHLAQGTPVAPRGDFKAQLLELRQQLVAWLAATQDFPATGPVPSDHARLRPPLRGEMMQAQKPEQPDIQPGTRPVDIARLLLAETDAAVDRIRLMQFAGISDRAAGQVVAAGEPAQRQWLTEIPMQMANGVAVLPLAIERDGGAGSAYAGAGPRIWRMRFTLETSELGPLDVTVALRGQHVDVKFWAERPATAAMIETARTDLATTLAQSRLTVDSVSCQAGRRPQPPQAPARSAGQFVDCRS